MFEDYLEKESRETYTWDEMKSNVIDKVPDLSQELGLVLLLLLEKGDWELFLHFQAKNLTCIRTHSLLYTSWMQFSTCRKWNKSSRNRVQ